MYCINESIFVYKNINPFIKNKTSMTTAQMFARESLRMNQHKNVIDTDILKRKNTLRLILKQRLKYMLRCNLSVHGFTGDKIVTSLATPDEVETMTGMSMLLFDVTSGRVNLLYCSCPRLRAYIYDVDGKNYVFIGINVPNKKYPEIHIIMKKDYPKVDTQLIWESYGGIADAIISRIEYFIRKNITSGNQKVALTENGMTPFEDECNSIFDIIKKKALKIEWLVDYVFTIDLETFTSNDGKTNYENFQIYISPTTGVWDVAKKRQRQETAIVVEEEEEESSEPSPKRRKLE